MSERAKSEADSNFEALRERWEKAKASGTTLAFAEEMMAGAVPISQTDRVYESEEERALYAEVRAKYPVTPADLLNVLPLYFGDEKGVSMADLLRDLEAADRAGGRSNVES